MIRKQFLQASVLAFSALWLSGCAMNHGAHHAQHRGANKVVIQVSDNDPAKWNLALNNAKNVQNDLGADKSEVEIVAYGPGIGMLKADSVTAARVTEATQAGIKVVACQNTMKGQKLTTADMNTSIGYVPAGVVEIMTRQSQGWAYVRP
jgi:uncharacterized protein